MKSSNVETIIKRYEAQLSFLQARDYGIAEIAISAIECAVSRLTRTPHGRFVCARCSASAGAVLDPALAGLSPS